MRVGERERVAAALHRADGERTRPVSLAGEHRDRRPIARGVERDQRRRSRHRR